MSTYSSLGGKGFLYAASLVSLGIRERNWENTGPEAQEEDPETSWSQSWAQLFKANDVDS